MIKGTGKMFVKRDGTVFFFCSRKCETNQLKLHRSPVRRRWTLHFANQKKMTSDAKKHGESNVKKGKRRKGEKNAA